MELVYDALYLAGLGFFALGLRFLPWSATARRGCFCLATGALVFAVIIATSLIDETNQSTLQFMAGLAIAVLLIIMAHWRFATPRAPMPRPMPHRRGTTGRIG